MLSKIMLSKIMLSKIMLMLASLTAIVVLSGCITSRESQREGAPKTGAITSSTLIQSQTEKTTTYPLPETRGKENGTQGTQTPLTITLYSDFQCPYCEYALPVLERIKAAYGEKITFEFKQFPLTALHADAERAAFAAECARLQGKFWTYHDLLFENQGKFGSSNLKEYARQVGLNTQDFNDCLEQNKTFDKVKRDFEEGRSKGVTSTPTFFVGGRMIVGAQAFEVFEKAIQGEAPGIGRGHLEEEAESLAADEESCIDGVRNQGEERPDCGGPCRSCKTSKDEVAACLNRANATLYYTLSCPQCKSQIEYFKDSFSLLRSVNCGKEKNACAAAGVKGYPTWLVSGKAYTAASIDSIRKASGC